MPISARLHRTTGGCVFTGVCLFTEGESRNGEGTLGLWSQVVSQGLFPRRGVPLASGSRSFSGGGYLLVLPLVLPQALPRGGCTLVQSRDRIPRKWCVSCGHAGGLCCEFLILKKRVAITFRTQSI